MTRILFWTLLVILVVAAIRSVLRRTAVPRDSQEARRGGDIESMVSCAHCHVHFPASEAVRADGQDYCSPAHVRLPPL